MYIWMHRRGCSHQSTTSHFTNPIQMQQPLDSLRSNTTSWYEDYYGSSPFYILALYIMALNRQVQYTGPVCRRMVPNQHLHNQYWPARSGPSRKRRRKGPRKAEHPSDIWIVWGGLPLASIRKCYGTTPATTQEEESYGEPVKEPINGWLQLNPSEKNPTIGPTMLGTCLRCEKYVDFSIHPASTFLSTTLCLGMTGSSTAPTPALSVPLPDSPI